ncbi:MAG TPA: hypothetical protein VNA69_15280 [Thermoanaerobaculia bacterium]|nr:hypothetical protein [Thermoanaerobaculia bacterium]
MTGLLFTLVWFPLIGAAVSRLAGRMNWFLAGAGMNGLALFIAGVLHIPLHAVLFVLGVAALVIVVAKLELPARPTLKPADAAIAISIVLLLAISAIKPLDDYDGRAFWLLKAKAIAHEARIDGPFFHGETAVTPRNEYPLLVPLDAATVMIAARDLDERHVRWLYALFAIALAWEVRRHAGPWLGALTLWLPQIAVSDAGGALTAYADIALAAFITCAVFELASESPGALRTGLWLSFIVLTKNEGLPFAVVLLGVSVSRLRARAILAATPLGIAAAALFLWRTRIDPTDEARFTLSALPERLDRLGDALLIFARHAVAFPDWGLFWIAVFAAGAFLAWQRRWRPLLIGAATIVPMIAIYLIMFVVSDWNTADLVNSTAPRLLTHFIGPAMLLLGHASREND